MKLKKLPYALSVCKVESTADINLNSGFYFMGKTGEELSLVCKTVEAPEKTIAREDGWRGFYIAGTLDFSLVGVLSKISSALAENNIGIFAVSTYNTDYILVKEKDFDRALNVLSDKGYGITE